MTTLHDFRARDIDGNERSLADFSGRVCLVVNVASQCGLTPHYAGLQKLHERYGVNVVGWDSPMLSASPTEEELEGPLEKVREARPHLLLVAMGAPKQEIVMHRFEKAYAPAVALGIGATLDFIAGTVQRAPEWMQKNGLEWAYRLSREPKRLWRRYLVDDPKFLLILAKTMARPKEERIAWR